MRSAGVSLVRGLGLFSFLNMSLLSLLLENGLANFLFVLKREGGHAIFPVSVSVGFGGLSASYCSFCVKFCSLFTTSRQLAEHLRCAAGVAASHAARDAPEASCARLGRPRCARTRRSGLL